LDRDLNLLETQILEDKKSHRSIAEARKSSLPSGFEKPLLLCNNGQSDKEMELQLAHFESLLSIQDHHIAVTEDAKDAIFQWLVTAT
jgi:hypothetical protein